jgi:hypothetical protein
MIAFDCVAIVIDPSGGIQTIFSTFYYSTFFLFMEEDGELINSLHWMNWNKNQLL